MSRACPYCGERLRLQVTVKQMRTHDGHARYGAYVRRLRCNARGPIKTTEDRYDLRNECVAGAALEDLQRRAETAWDGETEEPGDENSLPLFGGATGRDSGV